VFCLPANAVLIHYVAFKGAQLESLDHWFPRLTQKRVPEWEESGNPFLGGQSYSIRSTNGPRELGLGNAQAPAPTD